MVPWYMVPSSWCSEDKVLRHSSLLSDFCSWGSWAKGPAVLLSLDRWTNDYVYGECVLYSDCIPIRTPHAWLISSVTRRRVVLKIPHTAFALIELWRVESSRRGLLCLHLSILWRLASVHDIEIYPLRRCRQSVSDMHDISYKRWK